MYPVWILIQYKNLFNFFHQFQVLVRTSTPFMPRLNGAFSSVRRYQLPVALKFNVIKHTLYSYIVVHTPITYSVGQLTPIGNIRFRSTAPAKNADHLAARTAENAIGSSLRRRLAAQ